MNKPACEIELREVSLHYDLHHDRTNNLKELIINFLTRRRYVEKPFEQHRALDRVSLHIGEGERLGIVGFNGAGKSTLLKVISGILKPTSGYLKVRGSIQPLIELGAGFDPEFTGRENIYLNGYMLGFTKKQIQEKEFEIIEFIELGHFIDVPIKYYSSGMTVRLAFTIATMIQPEILLIDEMLGAGDAAFIQKAKKRLESIISQAKILVVVSHDLGFVREMCQRVLLVDAGRIVFDGEIESGMAEYQRRIDIRGRGAQ